MRENEGQDAQRHVDEEDRPPAESGDQNAAERRAERGADRGHRSEQPHGAAGPRLRNRLADERHGEGHHDGRAEALRRPGGNQQPERGRDAAQDRGHREQDDSGQQQPSAADDVTEPSDADDQGGDGEEIGEDDPLDLLEGGGERLCQRRQADIGDAGAERGQQHGQRKAGERPPNRRCPFRTSGDCLIASCNDWLHHELRFLATPETGLSASVGLCVTWRKTHHLHFIRAFDAISRSNCAMVDACRHPISTCSSPSMCCSRKAASRAPPDGCGSARRR